MNDPDRFRFEKQQTKALSLRGGLWVEPAVAVPTGDQPGNGALPAYRCDPVLSGQGFEIVTDVPASSPHRLAVAEPLLRCRRARREGRLDTPPASDHPALLVTKLVGHMIPVRLLHFALIGAIGVSIHLAVLRLAIGAFGLAFPAGQAIAAGTAMTGNFLLNNIVTYRDRRLRAGALACGLLRFYAVCGFGAAASVGLASHLFAGGCPWWLAGVGGAAIGALWNYALASIWVWRPCPRAPSAQRLATAATSSGRRGTMAAPSPAVILAAD